jgi:hypothetical protein
VKPAASYRPIAVSWLTRSPGATRRRRINPSGMIASHVGCDAFSAAFEG